VGGNPFGIQDFEKKEKPEGEYSLTPGGALRLRYRFYLHVGPAEEAGLAAAYAEYAAE
jgi:hypothetical protein